MNKENFEIGDIIYYEGRKDYKYFTYTLGTELPPKEGKVIYNELDGEMITATIVNISKRDGHSFGRGYFDTFTLDNGNQIEDYHCFKCVQDYEEAHKPIKKDSSNNWDFTTMVFPIIKKAWPKLIAEDIISVSPIKLPDELFIKE